MKNRITAGKNRSFYFNPAACWRACALMLAAVTAFAPRTQAASCLPPPSGLVGWWTGDGNALDIASTNNGTLQGGATDTAVGEVGQAFSFNGTTAYVTVPDTAALRPTNLTVETWVLFNSLNSTGNSSAGQQYIVFKQNTRSSWFEGYYLGKERGTGGDHFVFGVSSSAGVGVEADSGPVIATNVWYHVAGVRGSNFIQLYLNGQMVAQTAVTFAQNYGTEPLVFGSSGETYWDGKLSGLLDEVSLYNRALASNEIAAIYAAGSAGKCKAGQPPTVTVSPGSQSVAQGSNAVFTANAGGTPPLTYQWQFGGAPIGGATAATLTITNVQTTNAGSYTVVVSNSVTSVTSTVATLSVLLPPVITLQPLSSTNVVGDTITFTAAASGSLPLNYQWQLNGSNVVNGARISGANTNSLTISNVQSTDAGNYVLMVSNGAGATNSAPATLTVNGPPVITVQPASLSVLVGANVNFSVSATGTQPLSYQWLRNGGPVSDGGNLSGSATAVLSLTNVQLTDSSSFQVVITNIAGSSNSVMVSLMVNPAPIPPTIVSQPTNQSVIAGAGVSFSVGASGTAPLGYQWRKNNANLNNGGNVAGATTATLTLSTVSTNDIASYLVVVTNVAGSTNSAAATLTVSVPPVITAQPAAQGVFVGANVNFTVSATGTQPLGYQWSRNGAPLTDGGNISGSATATLSLTNVQTSNSANYSVTVSNIAGTTNSASAALAVSVPGSCDPAPAGVVSWWPGDGNALDIVSTNNGTLQAGATDTNAGEVGQTFSFNGTTAYVSVPDAPALKPTNLTVEAWVLFNSLNSSSSAAAGQQYIVFKQNTRSSYFEGYYLGKERTTGGDYFTFGVSSSAGAGVNVNSAAMIATNVWYHVAGVRGSNYIQLYVNGQVIGQTAVTFPQDYGTEPLFFGSSGESYWDGKLSGSLDEVTLYNRALASNEIQAIYAAGTAGKCKAAQPPAVTVLPSSQSVALGGNAIFAANASGTPPLTYQWQFGGAPIGGATAATLTVTNVQTTNAGSYTVVVSNSVTSVMSTAATLTILLPPVITSQPTNTTSLAGGTVTFTAGVSGSLPLNYQWELNGVSLANSSRVSGANTNSLTISNVQATDAGNYILMVSNGAGATNSTAAMLTVNGPPVINAQPISQVVAPGTLVTFSVSASGTAPLGYHWQFNGAPLSDGGVISGSSTSVLSLSSAQSNNAGSYSVTVTNVIGTTNSAVATLGISVPGSCDPAPSGLVGWWPGDGNANDVTGVNNGTLQGGATANAPGEDGPAFNFNGSTGYVSVPDNALLKPTNLTVEAWVLFTSLNSVANSTEGQQYIVFKQNSRTSYFEGYYLGKERTTGGDYFTFGVSSSAGVGAGVDSAPMIATNVWYHVAGVRGSNYIQLYVNGQLIGQSAVAFPQDYGIEPLFFGTSGDSSWDGKLAGYLDEVALYNRALSSNEIAAIYAAGSAGKCKAPAAPAIAGEPASQILTVGGTATFNVVAWGSTPLSYQWYKDGVKLANDTDIFGATAPSLTIQNLQLTDVGNYDVIVANSLGSVTSTVASLNTGVAPGNDNFINAQAISGSSGAATGDNFDATKEPGEPNHAGNAGGASVWYTWTAPSTSPVTFDTCLSAFDTLLAVYTGNAVNALTTIASNDDATTNCNRSRLTFTPVAGTVYYIAVDGKNGATGNVTLRWAQASVALPDLSLVASAVDPAIDTETFAPTSCAVQEGLIQAGTRTIIRFSTQTENSGTADMVFGNPADNPLFVWAPCHAHYHFQNYMSYRLLDTNGNRVAVGLKVGFCVLDVFRWSPSAASTALYSCTDQGIQVGWGDLYDSTLDGQWIDITGLPNGNYTMELEANPQGIIQEANYSNNVIHVPIAIGDPNAPPLNDNFASAQALLGGFATVAGSTVNATKEAGEPNHAGNAGGHSIWYTWNAPSTKAVTIDTINSSFNTLLAVYTGNAVNALTLVTSNDDIAPGFQQSRVTFNATAGTTYQIAVDGYNGASGSVVLTLNQTIENDNFVNAESIGGVGGVVYGSTSGATKEPGEPDHAGNPGGNSIWYYWTAPISGTATFNTLGSQFNTLLAVYTGTVVSNLTLVASDDDIAPPSNLLSSVTFNAIGLTRYDIAIDGYNGANGDSTLNWSLTAGAGPSLAGSTPINLANITPRLASSFLPEGEFQLQIAGLPLQNYRIEESCDLQHWISTVTTLADEHGYASFTDKTTMRTTGQSAVRDPICGAGQTTGQSGPRSRFYRAIPTSPN